MNVSLSTRSVPPILYLVPDVFGPPGGIARYSRLITRALRESGVGVHIVALMDRQGSAAESTIHLPGMAYMPCAGSRPAFIHQAARQALQSRPQLVLAGHVNFAPLGWALARLIHVPLVTFLYGIDAWAPLSRVRRNALQRSDRILAISRFTAGQAVQANDLDPTRLRVLNNCLDPQFELPALQPRLNAPPSLLTVARMSLAEQYKGHDVVIRALPELLRRFPDLRYDIVGDGDARPGLEALAQQMGVAEAVRFHGLVPEDILRERYAQASLFIMPSRAEGFGFVFLEAMAHGLAIIGGNVDATPEVVIHGETGLLVDPTSPSQVADAVASLLAAPEQRKRMGAAAQRRVAEHFSFSRFQHQLVTILGELDSRVSAST